MTTIDFTTKHGNALFFAAILTDDGAVPADKLARFSLRQLSYAINHGPSQHERVFATAEERDEFVANYSGPRQDTVVPQVGTITLWTISTSGYAFPVTTGLKGWCNKLMFPNEEREMWFPTKAHAEEWLRNKRAQRMMQDAAEELDALLDEANEDHGVLLDGGDDQ